MISKVYSDFLTNNQFGFKKYVGCSHAVYLRHRYRESLNWTMNPPGIFIKLMQRSLTVKLPLFFVCTSLLYVVSGRVRFANMGNPQLLLISTLLRSKILHTVNNNIYLTVGETIVSLHFVFKVPYIFIFISLCLDFLLKMVYNFLHFVVKWGSIYFSIN